MLKQTSEAKTMTTLEAVELPTLDQYYAKVAEHTGTENNKTGGGCFARVYSHPTHPDRVVKIAENDHAYNSYLNEVVQDPTNPFYPRIYSAKIFKCFLNVTAVVEMEKLQAKGLPFSGKAHDDGMKFKRYFRGWDITAYPMLAPFYAREHMKDTLERTHAAFQRLRKKHRLDLHGGNLMYRSNGQVVLTDPVAFNEPDFNE